MGDLAARTDDKRTTAPTPLLGRALCGAHIGLEISTTYRASAAKILAISMESDRRDVEVTIPGETITVRFDEVVLLTGGDDRC